MARTSRAAKKSNVVSVDFTGVETRKLLPEGEYVVTVKEVTQEKGQGEYPYLKWVFEVDGATVYNNTSFNPKALWNMKSLLEALRYELPEGPMDLDLDELAGLECNATIEHEAYEGKKQMRLVDFWPMDEVKDEEEEEEEKPAKKPKKAAAAPAEDEEEEEKPAARKKKKAAEPKKFSQEEVNEMDSDELTDLLEKCSIELDLSDFKTLRKQRSAVIDALEEAELLTEE